MKFSKTVVSVMFCIMCTTTIFGYQKPSLSKVVKIVVPEDIWDTIDKYREEEVAYKEIAHLHSYSSYKKSISSQPVHDNSLGVDVSTSEIIPFFKYSIDFFFSKQLNFETGSTFSSLSV